MKNIEPTLDVRQKISRIGLNSAARSKHANKRENLADNLIPQDYRLADGAISIIRQGANSTQKWNPSETTLNVAFSVFIFVS